MNIQEDYVLVDVFSNKISKHGKSAPSALLLRLFYAQVPANFPT